MKSLIKKETIIKIEEEIRNKTTIPNVLKEKIKKSVFTNIIIAVSMIIYFTFLIKGSEGAVKAVRSVDFNIFSILILTLSIYLFEIAYRKDNGKLAIYGIESLIIAVFTLFLPYIIFELNEKNKKYYLTASIFVASYYILKSLTISIKTKNKHMNSKISDVKEIVKKEKTKRRIKEEIEDIEETKIIKENKNKNEEKKKIEAEEVKPKKRGRPKKTETKNNENKPKEENAPKKRGRPRKVAVNND